MITTCFNFAQGNDQTQKMNCNSVGGNGCRNIAHGVGFDPDTGTFDPGIDNTQNMNCNFVSVGCLNDITGDENTQNLLCARMTSCNNVIGSFDAPIDSNTQSTTCANAGSCLNVGENTNVLANGVDCESHDPDTTTYCQPGRTEILPNP